MKTAKIYIIVLIFAMSICALYFFYKLHQRDEGKETSQSLRNAQTVSVGTGDIKNPSTWSIYQFKNDWRVPYPPHWTALLRQDTDGVTFITPGFQQDDDDSIAYGNGARVIYTIFNQVNTNDLHFHNGSQFPSDDNSQTLVVTHLKHFTIDGHEAIEFDYYPTSNLYFFRTRIAIRKGTLLYRFNASYAQDAGKKLFEEMIHSFHFISP